MGLRGRIGLLLLLHMAAMAGLFWVFANASLTLGSPPVYRLPPPQAVADIAAAFEQTPPSAHPDLVRALSDDTQGVTLLPALPPFDPRTASTADADRYREALKGRPFRIVAAGGRAPSDFGEFPVFSTDTLQVITTLADGRALAVSQMAIPPVARIVDNALWFVGLMIALNLIVALLIADQTRRPVERLLRAVQQDRPEDFTLPGPGEIVALGAAFRDLRTDLRALMEERTRILAAIAHDFRTYLTRINLRSDFVDDPRQRDLLVQDIAEMTTLIDDALVYAEGVKAPSGEAVVEVVAALGALAADRKCLGQTVAFDAPPEPLWAAISPVALHRIINNLLDNAQRYGGGDATLRIGLASGAVRIQVDDQGPGVPEAALERLTEPFHRLETSRSRETGGAGLGLSIVLALAQEHHARLSLANRPEGGFRAELQLQPAPPASPLA